MTDTASRSDPPISTVRDAFSEWKIWRDESCYIAELRPTPTARHVVVSSTLAGLSAKLGAETPARDGAR